MNTNKDWLEIMKEATKFSSRDIANTMFDIHVTMERFSRDKGELERAFALMRKKIKELNIAELIKDDDYKKLMDHAYNLFEMYYKSL